MCHRRKNIKLQATHQLKANEEKKGKKIQTLDKFKTFITHSVFFILI